MKYDDMTKDQGLGLMSLLQTMANAAPMAQVIILTIDGRRVAVLGPVVHAPHALMLYIVALNVAGRM